MNDIGDKLGKKLIETAGIAVTIGVVIGYVGNQIFNWVYSHLTIGWTP